MASDQSEVVRLFQEFEFGPTTDRLDMRGGDDQVVLSGMVVPVLAGPGTDWVRVVNFADERSRTPAREVSVDLMRDTLLVDDGGIPRPMQIQDVENFEVSRFGTAVLRGDAAGNELVAGQACLAKMYGLGGPDVLRARTNSQCTAHTAEFFGVPRRLVAYGNGGGDLLRGRETADRLFGGRGPDSADGRGVVDVCAAELRFRCE